MYYSPCAVCCFVSCVGCFLIRSIFVFEFRHTLRHIFSAAYASSQTRKTHTNACSSRLVRHLCEVESALCIRCMVNQINNVNHWNGQMATHISCQFHPSAMRILYAPVIAKGRNVLSGMQFIAAQFIYYVFVCCCCYFFNSFIPSEIEVARRYTISVKKKRDSNALAHSLLPLAAMSTGFCILIMKYEMQVVSL